MKNLSLSIVIPVYNSAMNLPELLRRLDALLTSLHCPYEIILVDDGSPDDSWNVISELAEQYSSIRGIHLMRNYGQHNALLCGIRAAQYDVIVTMDDDLQHPPEEIPKLLEKFAEGYDVVYGVPEHDRHNLWRNLASQITKFVLQNAMGAQIARNISAFRVFRAQLREAFDNYQSAFVSIDVLLTWGTTRFAAGHVRHAPRWSGQSNYTIKKLIMHALNMMTGFTSIPLRLASLAGFGFTVFGGFVFCYVVGRYLIQGGVVPGFAFLASTITIFSGAQLFALGIIGEYLARIHFRTMDRPAYTVRTTISGQ